MRQIGMLVLTLVVAAAFTTSRSASDEPKKVEHQLIGTWKLVSAKFGGTEVNRPEGTAQVKHVTPSQFMWAIYDKDGVLTAALGGTYTLKGESYEETPEYGTADVLQPLKGKPQSFKCKIEGNKWYHDGKLSSGLAIEEVWERVGKK